MAQAWKEAHETHSESIQKSFRQVGLSLAVDGSEDEELKIRDLPALQVGDWKAAEVKGQAEGKQRG